MDNEKRELIELIKISCRKSRAFLVKLNFNAKAYLDFLDYLDIQLFEIEKQDLSVLDSNILEMAQYKSKVILIFSIFLSCKSLFEFILSDKEYKNTITIDKFNVLIPEIQKILETIVILLAN